MKKCARTFFFIALAFLADFKLSLFGFRPDFIGFLAYWYGFTHRGRGGTLFGASLGGVEDWLNMASIGPGMLSRGVIGFFASRLPGVYFGWSPLLGFSWAFMLTAVGGMVEFASACIFGKAPDGLFREGILVLLLQGLVNGLLGFFVSIGPEERKREPWARG